MTVKQMIQQREQAAKAAAKAKKEDLPSNTPIYPIGAIIRHVKSGDVMACGLRDETALRATYDALRRAYPNDEFMIERQQETGRTRTPTARRRHRLDIGDPTKRGNVLYVINRASGEVMTVASGDTKEDAIANAIVQMSSMVPDLQSARTTFALCDKRPPTVRFAKRQDIVSMPFGRYEGSDFDHIPISYLERCLDSIWIDRYPELGRAIKDHLASRQDAQAYVRDEDEVDEEVNHLRDFTPSEFRGR